MQRYYFQLSFTFFLFTISLIYAQSYSPSDSSLWPTSPDSGLVIGYGVDPQIVSDGDGGAIVMFRANEPWQVKVKRVDRWGKLQWNGWTGVIAGGVGLNQEPLEIKLDENGGCFVLFKDVTEVQPPPPFNNPKYAFLTVQRIDHQGNKLWGEGIRVTTLDSLNQGTGQIYANGYNGCIVSWGENRTTTPGQNNNPNVFLQRFDSLGTRCWGDSGLQITPDSTDDSWGYMLTNEVGETFITWWNGSNYMMQKLDIIGDKLWGMNGLLADQVPWPVGMSDRNGGFILAGILSTNGRYRLACQHIDSSGERLWGANGVTLVDSVLIYNNESKATGMLFDNTGNIFIYYYFAKSGESDIYLQKLTTNGTKLFGEEGMPISEYPSSKNGGGIIRSNANILCVWTDNRGNGGTYIQKFDFFGNRFWNEDILFYSDAFNDFTHDCYGGLIIVDYNLDFSINLIKISKNGVIGEVITSIVGNKQKIIPNDYILYQNYPNPFNGTTTIQFWLNKTSDVVLKIYNINGSILENLNLGSKVSGEHRISLDMSAYASGIYFYQLTAGKRSQVKKFLLIK